MHLLLADEEFEVSEALASECATLTRLRQGSADNAKLIVPLDSCLVQRKWLRVWLRMDERPDMKAADVLEVVKVRLQIHAQLSRSQSHGRIISATNQEVPC